MVAVVVRRRIVGFQLFAKAAFTRMHRHRNIGPNEHQRRERFVWRESTHDWKEP